MTRDLIFDLGMNNGDDTDFYLRKGFRVVAVEANPELCDLGARRFAAEIESGKLRIIHAAVGKSSGTIELFVNEATSGWTTTNPRWLETRVGLGTSARSVVVPAVAFQEIVREHGTPYYLKADIQGAEMDVLEALLPLEDRPRFVSISSGADVIGSGAMAHVRRQIVLLGRLGYRGFKIVQQRDTEREKCPYPAREGDYVDFAIRHGQSGLFGEELPGEWLDDRRALREYRRIVLSYRLAGTSPSPSAWFKRLPSARIRDRLDRLFWRGTGWYDTHARHGV